MQWHALLGLESSDDLGGSRGVDARLQAGLVVDPPVGATDIETLDALCRVLSTYGSNPRSCYFGLCTIQGWLEQFSPDELKPLLGLAHGRDYIVLNGVLGSVEQIVRDWSKESAAHFLIRSRIKDAPARDYGIGESIVRDVPGLVWPADRSWFSPPRWTSPRPS